MCVLNQLWRVCTDHHPPPTLCQRTRITIVCRCHVSSNNVLLVAPLAMATPLLICLHLALVVTFFNTSYILSSSSMLSFPLNYSSQSWLFRSIFANTFCCWHHAYTSSIRYNFPIILFFFKKTKRFHSSSFELKIQIVATGKLTNSGSRATPQIRLSPELQVIIIF